MGLSGEAAEVMDSRERVFRALERSGPDRLPIYFTLLPGTHLRHGEHLDELLQRYPSDFSDAGGGGRSRARTHGGCIRASNESD